MNSRERRSLARAEATVQRWEIVNVSSVGTRCGRYATREDALEHAKTYDEIVRVDDDAKRVYVASRVLL